MASTILPVLTPEMKDEIKDLISGVLNHNLQVLGEVNVGVFSAASVALLSKPITNDVLIFSDDDVPNGSFPGLAGDLYIQRIDNGTSAKLWFKATAVNGDDTTGWKEVELLPPA